jgi:hypothetical protein
MHRFTYELFHIITVGSKGFLHCQLQKGGTYQLTTVLNIKLKGIKFVIDLRQISGFLLVLYEPCIGLRMNSSISSPLVAKASSIVRIRGGVCNPT